MNLLTLYFKLSASRTTCYSRLREPERVWRYIRLDKIVKAVSADKEVHRLSPGTSTLRGQRETELSVTESEKE